MAAQKRPVPEIVEVEWIDSQSWMGWHRHDDVVQDHGDEKDKLCRTAGYLVSEDKSGVTLALSRTVPTSPDGVNARSWGDTIFIPAVAVRKKTTLRSR